MTSTHAPRQHRSFASRLFGYDIFISFALGFSGRGTQSYASDLARQLRERDFAVFYSEDEAAPGEDLDDTLREALRHSRILVVIANRGTLETPRWVRVEVEEFRKAHPGRPVIPISIDGALEDPTLLDTIRPWLNVKETIWLDDTQDAVDKGAASRPVVERLSLAPRRLRTAQWWRVTVIGVALSLVALTASSLWSEQRARANAARAEASATAARAAEARALGELRASTGLRLRAPRAGRAGHAATARCPAPDRPRPRPRPGGRRRPAGRTARQAQPCSPRQRQRGAADNGDQPRQ
jgi:hypothetical protein